MKKTRALAHEHVTLHSIHSTETTYLYNKTQIKSKTQIKVAVQCDLIC